MTSKKWQSVSLAGKDMIHCLLNLWPQRRPSATMAKQHHWFQNDACLVQHLRQLKLDEMVANLLPPPHQQQASTSYSSTDVSTSTTESSIASYSSQDESREAVDEEIDSTAVTATVKRVLSSSSSTSSGDARPRSKFQKLFS